MIVVTAVRNYLWQVYVLIYTHLHLLIDLYTLVHFFGLMVLANWYCIDYNSIVDSIEWRCVGIKICRNNNYYITIVQLHLTNQFNCSSAKLAYTFFQHTKNWKVITRKIQFIYTKTPLKHTLVVKIKYIFA